MLIVNIKTSLQIKCSQYRDSDGAAVIMGNALNPQKLHQVSG